MVHCEYTRNSSADEKPERDVLHLRPHRTRRPTTKYKQQLDNSKPNINPSSNCPRRCASYRPIEYEKCNMKP